MSKVGKLPVAIPAGVTINVADGLVSVKGPKGELKQAINGNIKVEVNNNELVLSTLDNAKQTNAYHLLYRSLISNMVKGVSEGFTKEGFVPQTKTIVIPALNSISVLRLPNMLETIDEEAFTNLSCYAVIIPDGCTAIGERAFYGCENLLYVRLPSSLMSFPDSAFEGCNPDLVFDYQ